MKKNTPADKMKQITAEAKAKKLVERPKKIREEILRGVKANALRGLNSYSYNYDEDESFLVSQVINLLSDDGFETDHYYLNSMIKISWPN